MDLAREVKDTPHRAPGRIDPAQLERLIIFPLPRVVLLPGMPMPLHIFEPRYRKMTRDALEQNRYIAMATLDPDGELDGAQRPRIRALMGVGALTEWEELPDGRYHILLEGIGRARLVSEHRSCEPYREVRAELVPDVQGDARATRASVDAVRGLMMSLRVRNPKLAELLREELEEHPDPGEFSNRLGAMMHGDVESQYELLGMTDVSERMDSVVEHLSDFLARTSGAGEDELN
ncbi:MAG: LON peptidase substrate-binding domain-containing protein [Sandaracinaceae bacterium]|nr:LON peptidase substrate-binding domain-containing protein [Sandaracinaceae bacterium]